MAITLTTPVTIPNGTRLVITAAKPDDDAQQMRISYELRTPLATDLVLSSHLVVVRNGMSDRLVRNASPAAGSQISSVITLEQAAISTPTGYTDAIAAWRAAATPAARRAALDALGLSAGWIDSSLTGT